MCLSTAYLKTADGGETVVMKNVAGVRVNGSVIVLSDILGAETPVPGTLAYCDLVNGRLEILAA
ncbi:MAG: CooT family nickel-binding protein [Oscillospiraceae bacterium]|jgi:predicted RNA-binding protein|nr:CooT family nickel-binding protein [Oscillospiraceae bacterium]